MQLARTKLFRTILLKIASALLILVFVLLESGFFLGFEVNKRFFPPQVFDEKLPSEGGYPTETTQPAEPVFTYSVSEGRATITGYNGSAAYVRIPDSLDGYPVTAIGENAFSSQDQLKIVIIPASVRVFDKGAFSFCGSLLGMYFLGDAPVVDNSAFDGISKELNFYYLAGKKGFESDQWIFVPLVFDGKLPSEDDYPTETTQSADWNEPDDSTYAYDEVDGGVMILYRKGSSAVVRIPDTLAGKPVVAIENKSFSGDLSMRYVVIPATVKRIGSWAFNGSQNLEGVYFLGDLPSLDEEVFGDNSKDFTIYYLEGKSGFGDWVAGFPAEVFDGTFPGGAQPTGEPTQPGETDGSTGSDEVPTGLVYTKSDGYIEIKGYNGPETDLKIPAMIEGLRVTKIAESAFSMSPNLWQVELPDTVTDIGENAFYDCKNLQRVNLPDGLQHIGAYAFNMDRQLKIDSWPEALVDIGSNAFENCQKLTSVKLPESLAVIGDYSFCGCTALQSVTFAGDAPKMGEYVFEGCADNFTIYYTSGRSGFSQPWLTYHVVPLAAGGQTPLQITWPLVLGSGVFLVLIIAAGSVVLLRLRLKKQVWHQTAHLAGYALLGAILFFVVGLLRMVIFVRTSTMDFLFLGPLINFVLTIGLYLAEVFGATFCLVLLAGLLKDRLPSKGRLYLRLVINCAVTMLAGLFVCVVLGNYLRYSLLIGYLLFALAGSLITLLAGWLQKVPQVLKKPSLLILAVSGAAIAAFILLLFRPFVSSGISYQNALVSFLYQALTSLSEPYAYSRFALIWRSGLDLFVGAIMGLVLGLKIERGPTD